MDISIDWVWNSAITGALLLQPWEKAHEISQALFHGHWIVVLFAGDHQHG